jgi:hypothetical protein
MKTTPLLAAAALLAAPAADAQRRPPPRNDPPPTRPGTCAYTHVRQVTQRLEDGVSNRVIPDSGSAVQLANGLYQVSYDQVAAVNASRRGDAVWICLMTLPQNCPPGDDRGKLYTTTNLRTGESWTLPDAEHGCGGA